MRHLERARIIRLSQRRWLCLLVIVLGGLFESEAVAQFVSFSTHTEFGTGSEPDFLFSVILRSSETSTGMGKTIPGFGESRKAHGSFHFRGQTIRRTSSASGVHQLTLLFLTQLASGEARSEY